MEPAVCSDIVLSLAGHDSGRLYVVVGRDGGYACLADGKVRRLTNPKRKSDKHLRVVGRVDSPLAEKLRGGQLKDSEIRRALAQSRQQPAKPD